MAYETLIYEVDGAIATITLNRPEALNTIVPPMPDEFEAAVNTAVRDREELPLIAFVADPDGYRIELIDGGEFATPQDPED